MLLARLSITHDLVCCGRNAAGHIIKPAPFQARLTPGTVARVEPNRRWFGGCHSFVISVVDDIALAE